MTSCRFDRARRVTVLLLGASLIPPTGWCGEPHPPSAGRRGDANRDGEVDVSDAISTLGCLFLGSACATCADRADANDDGFVDVSDAVYTLAFLFSGGPAIPAAAVSCEGEIVPPEAPRLLLTLADGFEEAWLGSPAVADLDGDGASEVIAPRGPRLVVWRREGSVKWAAGLAASRIWASPVVADFAGDSALEVAVAAGDKVYLFAADGTLLPGFPVAWRGEITGLAAGDLVGDGRPELVAATTSPLRIGDRGDVLQAFRADGAVLAGFPPNTAGISGCTGSCYVAGSYDQGVALGPLGGDAGVGIVVAQDIPYIAGHAADGAALAANPVFGTGKKLGGVRFLLDYEQARAGFADDEEAASQSVLARSSPVIADIDGDGGSELVLLAPVQSVSQLDLHRGVALWVLAPDGARPAAWTAPFRAPAYLAGLEPLEGANLPGASNQVAVAELIAGSPGLEMVFAGFDGKIHAVDAAGVEEWDFRYTSSAQTLTSGVAVADLSGDGHAEVVFATYTSETGTAALFILDATGAERHRVPLPGRGALPVPTVADVDGDGSLEIVVSLKDAETGVRSVLVYTVPGSTAGSLPWPTARGGNLRDGWFQAGR